jgi:hypothetical protein
MALSFPSVIRRVILMALLGANLMSEPSAAQTSQFHGEFSPTHLFPMLRLSIGSPGGKSLSGIALIDSGSFASLVDDSLVARLELTQVGNVQSMTAAGPQNNPTYRCSFTMPDGKILQVDVAARSLVATDVKFDAMLGMDILRNYDIRMNANEKILTFVRK